jgi:hypothetical protein
MQIVQQLEAGGLEAGAVAEQKGMGSLEGKAKRVGLLR